MSDEFGADFVAAGADAGADGGEKVGRIGLKVRVQLADGFFEDAGEGAAPTSVNGGDGAFLGIDKENGDAIGGLHSEKKAGDFGERGVSFAWLFGCRFEGPDNGGVDLF